MLKIAKVVKLEEKSTWYIACQQWQTRRQGCQPEVCQVVEEQGWLSGSSGKSAVQQAGAPDFKRQYHKKKQKRKYKYTIIEEDMSLDCVRRVVIKKEN